MAFNFYNLWGQTVLSKKWLMCVVLYVVLPHLFHWIYGVLWRAFASSLIHLCLHPLIWMRDKVFVLQGGPLIFSARLFARTFCDAMAAGILTLSILITLSCIASAYCELLPFSTFCRLQFTSIFGLYSCGVCLPNYIFLIFPVVLV